MSKYKIAGTAGAAGLVLLAASPLAHAESKPAHNAKAPALEMSSQTRLYIRPRRRGELLPGDLYYYPGVNAVRTCQSWLQRELRPSGPVITPQMRCRWVPG